jgi:hypothetical protein
VTGEQLTLEELEERQRAADQAAAVAEVLVRQPLTRQAKRDADRAAGIVRRLEHLDRNRRKGIR